MATTFEDKLTQSVEARRLAEFAGEPATRSKAWPRSPRGLSGELRRLAPALRRALGVDVQWARAGRSGARTITLQRGAAPSAPSAPSAATPQQPARADGRAPAADGSPPSADGRLNSADGADGSAPAFWSAHPGGGRPAGFRPVVLDRSLLRPPPPAERRRADDVRRRLVARARGGDARGPAALPRRPPAGPAPTGGG